MPTRIFYKPHPSRQREAAFVQALIKHYPDAELVAKNALIDAQVLDRYVDTPRLIAALRKELLLPAKARQRCLDALAACPTQIKIANDPARISFDVVVEQNGARHYWEFHEEQHQKLNNSRMRPIYTPDGTAVVVPRFLQRLIRDVWRVEYFRPFTIVWHNWFAHHNEMLTLPDPTNFAEYGLDDQFLFGRFWLPLNSIC